MGINLFHEMTTCEGTDYRLRYDGDKSESFAYWHEISVPHSGFA